MHGSSTVFIFDVDGTLTPARLPIRAPVRAILQDFMVGRTVYFITGSDIAKLRQQLDPELLHAATGYFTCAGAERWAGERRLSHRVHNFPRALYDMLTRLLAESDYPRRFGQHIEERTGMLNFSSVGRNALTPERKAYFAWDRKHGERRAFVRRLRACFPQYEFSAGGEISIDIVPAGASKAQVLPYLADAHPEARFVFYGNRLDPDGNDRPLADALRRLGARHSAIAVEDDDGLVQVLADETA